MCKQSNQRYRKELEKKVQNSYAETIRNAAKSNAEKSKICNEIKHIYHEAGGILGHSSMSYNCTIIDLFDRSVVASETGKWITSDLVIKTLDKA